MTKVICIDDTHWAVPGLPCPKFGEILSVEDAYLHPFTKNPVYSFYEYPVPPGYSYRVFSQKYFAPLSDIDESEFSTEKIVRDGVLDSPVGAV